VAFFHLQQGTFVATTTPAVSAVREKVIRERTVPPEELAREKTGSSPDFWEYIEAIKPEQWIDHIVYLYRQEPKTTTWPGAPPAYLDKYVGEIEVRPGFIVPMNDAGTIQQAIKEKFGGRVFRLILKKGRERMCETTFSTEAAPKYPDATPQHFQPPQSNPAPGQSDANAIASKAIDTVANQPAEAMNIALNALRASADIIARSAQVPVTPANAATVDSELDRAFKQAMIAKLLAPPPDPVQTFLQIKQALGDGGSSNANGFNTLLEPILKAAVDRIVNPVAPITGRTTLLDLGREFIPVLGTTVRETMHEYRLSREADARIMELQRGMHPPAQPTPTAMAQLPVIEQAPPAAANPPANPAPATQLTFPQIATHIANIVKNVEYPVEEAVDRVLSFLYDTDGRLVGLLLDPPKLDPRLAPGKQGLVMLFQNEPALQTCMTNVPRVSEFIDKFIVAATEAEAAEARLRAAAPGNGGQPAAVPPA
jgi:hypothetical protein